MAEANGKLTESVLPKNGDPEEQELEDMSVKEAQSTREKETTYSGNEDDDDDDNNTDGVPYDRGWAWMVLLGSVVNYGLINSHLKTSGVVFVELLHYFQAPASYTALLFALRGGVLSIAAMFIMNVVIGRLGCRKTALIGGVLMSLSAILASLAYDLILFICLQAVLIGVSDCMIGSTGEVLTARYFRKRRSLAMAFIKASSSVVSIAYPPLLTHLLSSYGLRGALLLSGGISLHALPAALLLRPVSFYQRKRTRPPKGQNHEGAGKSEEEPSEHAHLAKQPRQVEKPAMAGESDSQSRKCEFEDGVQASVPGVETSLTCAVLEDEDALGYLENGDASKKVVIEMAHTYSVQGQDSQESTALLEQKLSVDQKPTATTTEDDDNTQGGSKHRRPLRQRLKGTLCVLDFSLFRRPSFILLFTYYMFSPNINVGMDYLPALAEQQGMSKAQAAQLLSIVGALDLVSRLSVGFVVNLKLVPVPVLAGVALTGLGTVYQCTRWLTSFQLLAAMAAAQGLWAGAVNGLTSLIILHVVGLPHMAKAIGFQFLAEGAFSSAIHPLLGYIRDRTGTYVIVYHVTGCCLLMAAFVLLCEELVRQRERRQDED